MRRLALVLALGLVMVGLLLAAAGGISGPGSDARSASYDELAADAPTGFSGETSALSVEPPSVRLLDQMWSDYVYDTPAVARVGARVAPGDGGVSSPAVPGDGAVAVPASAAEGAATTPSTLTYTPSAAGAADDVVVLGKYPDYVNLADDLGARRFNVPDSVWNGMSDAERWAANQRFLDRAIARGSEIRLASRVTPSNLTGYYAREIEYLVKQGYRISDDGLRMLPPG